MKTIFKSFIAVAVSAIITASSAGSIISASTSTTAETYTLSFNYTGEGVTCEDESLLQPQELKGGKTVNIPDIYLESETLGFSGWTYDNIRLYAPGDAFKMPESDVTLEPVWYDPKDEDVHTVSYNVVIDGVVPEEGVPISRNYVKGEIITIPMTSFDRDGFTQIGWTDGENVFNYSEKLIMPDHDVVLEPKWYEYFVVYYEAGDVDRINGVSAYAFERFETNKFDLADSTRLSRSGFDLTGWTCDYDGQVYKPGAYYTMPASDVRFTAIWTPKTYNVVFKVNNGTSSLIKISGQTDTAITVPECDYTYSGYVFKGWKFNDTIYQPGEEFIIPGALPGLGISLTGVWEEEGASQEEVNSLSLAAARSQYVNGEIAADELSEISDFILNR